jgi:hypothetical protein
MKGKSVRLKNCLDIVVPGLSGIVYNASCTIISKNQTENQWMIDTSIGSMFDIT